MGPLESPCQVQVPFGRVEWTLRGVGYWGGRVRDGLNTGLSQFTLFSLPSTLL